MIEKNTDDVAQIERLKTKGYDVFIEEIGGKRKFFLDADTLEFYPFERRFLGAHTCRVMLPVSFLKMEKRERVYYDITGMMELGAYIALYRRKRSGRLTAGEDIRLALALFSGILKAVQESENYLLFLERYYLGAENIFVDPKYGDIKIAYLPERNVYASVKAKIEQCLTFIAERFQDEEVTSIAKRLNQKMVEYNLGVLGMLKVTSEIKREISSAYGEKM